MSLQQPNPGSSPAHVPMPLHIFVTIFKLYFLHRLLYSPIQFLLNLPDPAQASSPWETFSGSQVRLSIWPVLRIQESYLGINHITFKLWFHLFFSIRLSPPQKRDLALQVLVSPLPHLVLKHNRGSINTCRSELDLLRTLHAGQSAWLGTGRNHIVKEKQRVKLSWVNHLHRRACWPHESRAPVECSGPLVKEGHPQTSLHEIKTGIKK